MTPPKPKLAERCGPERIKWWRLKEKEAAVVSNILLSARTAVDETWERAAESITRVARSKLGMTKHGRRELGWLMDFFSHVAEEKKVPESRQKSTTIPVWKKKGSHGYCICYRPTSLLSHSMKIFERIVDSRIRDIVELTTNQCGFLAGCSTIDAIHATPLLLGKHRGKRRPVHLAFLELEKASDRVPRDITWYALRQRGFPEELIEWVLILYSSPRSRVQMAACIS
uniref:Reverse transcriptase domain-containing protein n=1 Tax=Haemonchus contortus TaxID=6289 RepID=A0A7I4Y7H2_HAECO